MNCVTMSTAQSSIAHVGITIESAAVAQKYSFSYSSFPGEERCIEYRTTGSQHFVSDGSVGITPKDGTSMENLATTVCMHKKAKCSVVLRITEAIRSVSVFRRVQYCRKLKGSNTQITVSMDTKRVILNTMIQTKRKEKWMIIVRHNCTYHVETVPLMFAI